MTQATFKKLTKGDRVEVTDANKKEDDFIKGEIIRVVRVKADGCISYRKTEKGIQTTYNIFPSDYWKLKKLR